MHEMGVAMEICRIAEARVGTESAAFVTRLAVTIGDEAGVEPSSLEFCLDALLAQPPFGGATAQIISTTGDTLRLDYLEIDDDRESD